MTDFHFDVVAVWDNLGGFVKVRPGGTVDVVDPTSGDPVTVVQNGQSGTTVTADMSGRSVFVAQQGFVRLISGGLSMDVRSPDLELVGTGTVTSVAGQPPDATGAVELTAADVGAMPAPAGDSTQYLDGAGTPQDVMSLPISDATQGALDNKQPVGEYLTAADLANYVQTDDGGLVYKVDQAYDDSDLATALGTVPVNWTGLVAVRKASA